MDRQHVGPSGTERGRSTAVMTKVRVGCSAPEPGDLSGDTARSRGTAERGDDGWKELGELRMRINETFDSMDVSRLSRLKG